MPIQRLDGDTSRDQLLQMRILEGSPEIQLSRLARTSLGNCERTCFNAAKTRAEKQEYGTNTIQRRS